MSGKTWYIRFILLLPFLFVFNVFSSDVNNNNLIDECESATISGSSGTQKYFDCTSAMNSCTPYLPLCTGCPTCSPPVPAGGGKYCESTNGNVLLQCYVQNGASWINTSWSCTEKTASCDAPLIMDSGGNCVCPNPLWGSDCIPPSQNPVCTSGENTPVPNDCPPGQKKVGDTCEIDCESPYAPQELCNLDSNGCAPDEIYALKSDGTKECVNSSSGSNGTTIECREYGYNSVTGMFYCLSGGGCPEGFETVFLNGQSTCQAKCTNGETRGVDGQCYPAGECPQGYDWYDLPSPGCISSDNPKPNCDSPYIPTYNGTSGIWECINPATDCEQGEECASPCEPGDFRGSDGQCHKKGECPPGEVYYDVYSPGGMGPGCYPNPVPGQNDYEECKSPYGDWYMGDCFCEKFPGLCNKPGADNKCPNEGEIYFEGECICDVTYDKINGICVKRDGYCPKNEHLDLFHDCVCNRGYVRMSGTCQPVSDKDKSPDGCNPGEVFLDGKCQCPEGQSYGSDGRCFANDGLDKETYNKGTGDLLKSLQGINNQGAVSNKHLSDIKDAMCGGKGQPACAVKLEGTEVDFDKLREVVNESVDGETDSLIQQVKERLDSIDSDSPVKESTFTDNLPFLDDIRNKFTFETCGNSFIFSAFGHSIILSFCDKFSDIRNIAGWVFYILTLIGIINLVFRSTSHGDKL